jgi:hypothetical protein
MDKPDQRLFEAQKGYWGLSGTDMQAEQPEWPLRILWVAAVPRVNAPVRFYLQLDFSDYRTVPPTGTFWDPATKSPLDHNKRPKGKKDSRLAKVFRTDWEGGRAFYHPYDRVAAKGHPNWATEQPSLIWDCSHTIVDYLEEMHSLLNSGDYLGL